MHEAEPTHQSARNRHSKITSNKIASLRTRAPFAHRKQRGSSSVEFTQSPAIMGTARESDSWDEYHLTVRITACVSTRVFSKLLRWRQP
jgi:hypothetical protein